jgi:hypothetical protein
MRDRLLRRRRLLQHCLRRPARAVQLGGTGRHVHEQDGASTGGLAERSARRPRVAARGRSVRDAAATANAIAPSDAPAAN